MQNFDVNIVNLKGNNLIEASAGTGKTYSVGILVLRLLLENKISVKEILMVTFTEAAVEELKSRIRSFIYQAWQYSKNNQYKIEESGIKKLVDNYTDKEEVARLLNEAILLIDEFSIFTIHGFCTRTLKEFAFETNQNFDLKMMADMTELNNEALHTVWRKNITTLPENLLLNLINFGFSQEKLKNVYKQIAENRTLADEVLGENVSLIDIQTEIQNLETIHNQAPQKLKSQLLQQENLLTATAAKVLKSTTFYKKFGTGDVKIFEEFDLFITLFTNLSDKEKSKFDASVLEIFEVYNNEIESFNNYLKLLSNTIYVKSAKEILAEVNAIKLRRNLQSFDDLILNLHTAIHSQNNIALINGLRHKYKAVFIDEFQDTDKLQYEIFATAFEASNSVMFYIGDPKQSIYSFRKADLDTYKLARSKAQCFTMDQNFRSNNLLINEFNDFFNIDNPFLDDEIEYQKVTCGKTKLGFLANETHNQLDAFDFFTYKNKPSIHKHLVESILMMLTKPYQIVEEGNNRKIEPKDIGILVRSNAEAKELKLAFGKRGIPTVVVDDSKIFQAKEVNYVIYILQAISDINNNAINKALATPLFLDHFEDIAKIDHSVEMLRFEQIKNTFNTKGVYAAFQLLLEIYNLKSNLLQSNHKNGSRIIANFLHIIELLHKQQSRFKLTLDEMIDWLIRAQNGGVSSDNNFELRLESDENAVNIVTVHKSKGLAYNIVFAPFLESEFKLDKSKIYNFKHLDEYKFTITNDNEDFVNIQKLQYEQEAKRLIYVALTRAVYYCAVYGKEKSNSALSPFLQNWKANKNLISIEDNFIETNHVYTASQNKLTYKKPLKPSKSDFLKQWSVLSYSSIATHGEKFNAINIEQNTSDELDNFVFNKMPKGANFGNFIHFLLENISFDDNALWNKKIHFAAQKYLSWQTTLNASNESDQKQYFQFLEHICNTTISAENEQFKIANIQHKISEMQFYFDYKSINLNKLKNVLPQYFELEHKQDIYLEGLMNGFIDLVFEMNGKYYILDWKTNYLGNNLEAYNQENLLNAMNTNNYHLQYMVYTVALVRYLRKKIPNFNYNQHFGGVFYLFVRGVRKNNNTGIFSNRLTEEEWASLELCLMGE